MHAVAINMTQNPMAQRWCGVNPDVEFSALKLKVCIMFPARHTLLSDS